MLSFSTSLSLFLKNLQIQQPASSLELLAATATCGRFQESLPGSSSSSNNTRYPHHVLPGGNTTSVNTNSTPIPGITLNEKLQKLGSFSPSHSAHHHQQHHGHHHHHHQTPPLHRQAQQQQQAPQSAETLSSPALHLTEIAVHQQATGGPQTIQNGSFHIQHVGHSSATGAGGPLGPPPIYPSASGSEVTGLKPLPSVGGYPFPSPPYSAHFNTNFKSVFGGSESSNASSNPLSSQSISITNYSPTFSVSNTLLEPPKSYIDHHHHHHHHHVPTSQPAFSSFFPKPEPTSPGSCLHALPVSTPSWWPTAAAAAAATASTNNSGRPTSGAPWSAPPLQSAQSAFTYTNGSSSFTPLSPLSPLSPMSAPGNNQPIPLYATSVASETQQLSHEALRWPNALGYFDSAPAQPRRLRRVACTCPNCVNGINTKAANPDGTPKKKQHVCHYPGCKKVYGKTSHLRAHLRWHTGERPFVCNWLFCGKRFTRSDELQRHLRTHTGEKRFICPECSKRFMRSDHLSKHVKTHQKVREKAKGIGVGETGSPPPLSPTSSESRDIDTPTTSSSLCSPPPVHEEIVTVNSTDDIQLIVGGYTANTQPPEITVQQPPPPPAVSIHYHVPPPRLMLPPSLGGGSETLTCP